MNVLLIEPDRILAQTYKQALESEDMLRVKTVRGAQAAITAADILEPDLVILELQLIEHSGIEFLYEFRSYSDWQTIPVIIQTIVPFSEFQNSWHLLKSELGVRAYLYKPHTSLQQLRTYVKEYSPVVK